MTSSLRTLVNDFKQQLKIQNNVVTWISKERKFVIIEFCLEKDISVKRVFDYLNLLYKHHGLNWLKLNPFEVTETISINKNFLQHLYLLLESSKKNVCSGSTNKDF